MTSRRLAIVGASGRMGAELRALAQDFRFTLVGGISNRETDLGGGLKTVSQISKLDSKSVDVVIDFSLPELTGEVSDWCAKNGVRLVSGVTGLKDVEKSALKIASARTAVLWAPNMSLGVAVMARMIRELSHLEGYEFQIEELHHKRKKDRPSGTALLLQEKLKEAVPGEHPEPLAVRGGGIFGIHRIWAMGEEETLTIEHNAMNRRVFARGALKAADWLLNKPPGLYKIDDVL